MVSKSEKWKLRGRFYGSWPARQNRKKKIESRRADGPLKAAPASEGKSGCVRGKEHRANARASPKKMRSNAARGNVLRALGREMSSRARSARVKLGELSGAELAIGGIGGLGAIVAGGLLLSNLSGSSGASGVGGVGGDLDTAKMRQMDTTDLLDYFSRASEPEKQKVADFCVCRVHDLRDLRAQVVRIKRGQARSCSSRTA